MISRMTLVGALVVVELGIVGIAARAVGGGGPASPFAFESPLVAPHGGSTSDVLEKSFLVGLTPHVVIDTSGVHVIVQTASTGSVHVAGRTHRSGWVSGTFPAVSAVQTEDGVRVSSPADDGPHFTLGSLRREVRITVPATALVEVTGADQVDVSGLRAKFVAHVSDGPVYLKDHRGDVDISVGVVGRVVLTDVQATDIAVNTREGRLLFTRVGADRIDAATNSGRIAAIDLRALDGALITHEGRVSVSFTGTSDATVNVHTGDGHVRVAGLPTTETEARRSVVRVGSGRGHFEVSSGDGSITITQGASV
jgi:putative adhesin